MIMMCILVIICVLLCPYLQIVGEGLMAVLLGQRID